MLHKLFKSPFQEFVRTESLSGILLLFATLLAVIWANSNLSHIYESLWDYKAGISSDKFTLVKPLLLWINDGLMSVFFFLIGLEIKRELLIGELNSLKKAALPVYAAFGGMVVPIVIFLLINNNPETRNGWGIPMATDIAFSLAILQLLGKRIPIALKVFLTAFAIVDDLGSVIIIALFYSAVINWHLLLYASALFVILFILSFRGIYIKKLTLIFGIIIWLLFLKSGIHPTIAGVILAFTVPIRQKTNIRTYMEKLCEISQNFNESVASSKPVLTREQIEQIDELEEWTDHVRSPLQHIEHRLHTWVAFLIMPLFALANSGVNLSYSDGLDQNLILSISLALILGKTIGIFGMALLTLKTGLAETPSNSNLMQIFGVSLLAGVGFTMSIFIANLSLSDFTEYANSAKTAILIGSLISGISGYIVLRISPKTNNNKPS